jgi:hypothetical protein
MNRKEVMKATVVPALGLAFFLLSAGLASAEEVCVEPGPGYPRGPSCLRYAQVNSVSGSYCVTPGGYAGPSCLEYGTVNPPYPGNSGSSPGYSGSGGNGAGSVVYYPPIRPQPGQPSQEVASPVYISDNGGRYRVPLMTYTYLYSDRYMRKKGTVLASDELSRRVESCLESHLAEDRSYDYGRVFEGTKGDLERFHACLL